MNIQPDATRSPRAGSDSTDEALVDSATLVEEVSIDGMCGVY